MKFRYIGEEYSEIFGFKWATGMVHDVEDAHAVTKLSRMTNLFELAADGEAKAMAKRFAPAEVTLQTPENVTPIRKPRAKKAAG
jgi:hypothetical protein